MLPCGFFGRLNHAGAKFLTDYRREGNLIWPTLLDNVTSNMRIAWEEPFGPVLPIMRISSPEQAVEHCNKNSVALQVGWGKAGRGRKGWGGVREGWLGRTSCVHRGQGW